MLSTTFSIALFELFTIVTVHSRSYVCLNVIFSVEDSTRLGCKLVFNLWEFGASGSYKANLLDFNTCEKTWTDNPTLLKNYQKGHFIVAPSDITGIRI